MKPKNLSDAIEDLENKNSNDGGEATDFRTRVESELRRMEKTLSTFKPDLDQLKETVGEHAKTAKIRVEKEVAKNPWAALGIVGLLALLLGYLLGHKSTRSRD